MLARSEFSSWTRADQLDDFAVSWSAAATFMQNISKNVQQISIVIFLLMIYLHILGAWTIVVPGRPCQRETGCTRSVRDVRILPLAFSHPPAIDDQTAFILAQSLPRVKLFSSMGQFTAAAANRQFWLKEAEMLREYALVP